jgi:hypothetical protein
MMNGGQADYRRLAWFLAGGLTLAGWAAGFLLCPAWRVPAPRLRPSAPAIALHPAAGPNPPENQELKKINSPILIALAQGLPRPGTATSPACELKAPSGPPFPPLPGLTMPLFSREADSGSDAGSILRCKVGPGAGVSAGIFQTRVGPKGPAVAGGGGVNLEYTGGLEGKFVEVMGWSWGPWTQAGTGWLLNLEIQSDEQGRIIEVLLLEPAADAGLNEALIQSLYQRGRVQPPGTCRGRVKASFAGGAVIK